jgi:hypothetical protein
VQTSLNQKIEQGKLLKSGKENTSMQWITRTFDELRQTINNYEKALKSQIHAIEEKNNMVAENYLKLLNKKQGTLSNHNRDFGQILSTNNYTQLLETKTRLTDYIEQLSKELKELEVPVKTEYRIEGVGQLQTNINDILTRVRVIEQRSGNCFDHT